MTLPVALDTNVLVRLLVNDEPGQALRAAELIDASGACLGGIEELWVGAELDRAGGSAGMLLGGLGGQLLRLHQPFRLGIAEGHKLSALVMAGDGLDVVAADPSATHQGNTNTAAGDRSDGVEHEKSRPKGGWWDGLESAELFSNPC